jgi:NADH dehydrogenase FAD-containing subunit
MHRITSSNPTRKIDMSIPSGEKQIILVLGASYAGLSITHYLLKHTLASLPNHQIVLVNPTKDVMCRPACPRAMLSDTYFNQTKLFVDIPSQLSQYPSSHWTFLHGSSTSIDHKTRTAIIKLSTEGTSTTIHFHALVIATGASTPSPLLSNGPDIRDAWRSFRTALPSAKNVVVAGGGPAGVECAGEIGAHLAGRGVSITLIITGTRILPSLRPAIADSAEKLLEGLGVRVIKDVKVVAFENGMVRLSNGQEMQADVYIPATGTKPNTQFLAPELLAEDGRVETNSRTLRVDAAGPRVYALGDCSSAFRPAVHNIMAAVPVLAANMARDLRNEGGGADKLFEEDMRETQLVPVGRSKGVGAAMGWRLPSWLVWAIKGRDYWVWTTGRLWSGRQW